MEKDKKWFGRKKPTQLPKNTEDAAAAQATDEALEDSVQEDGAAKSIGKVKKSWSRRRIVVVSILGVVVLALAGAGIWALSIFADPMAQFNQLDEQMTPPPASTQNAQNPGETLEPGASPTIDPYEALLAQADSGFLKDIVNIMLIGVDNSVDRNTEEWVKHGGKQDFHSDVMIVLSVNKTTGAVNMISLPRDTYAKIPDIDGIYKLNASINCGGGWPCEENQFSMKGFEKVCDAASWMLGGIPVQYYYAVDMNAVKGLVDAIGGVQGFDVEMDFKMAGRSYTRGVQDMNGQAVLDYLRVRKGIDESGDLNRINRQKKMLVAIFDKIKQNGLLTSIPSLLDAFDGNLYTNTTLNQTAALAAFGFNVDAQSIGMYSMGGKYNIGIFNWNFVLTDQKARVKLIKQIYGVDVEEYKDYSPSAAVAKWNRMQLPVVRKGAEGVLAKVKAKLDADAKLPIYGAPTPTPPPSTTPPPATTTPPPATTTPPPVTTTPPPEPPETTASAGALSAIRNSVAEGITILTSGAPSGYRQYLPDGVEWKLYNKCRDMADSLSSGSVEAMKENIEALCKMFGVSVPSWNVSYENKNEVIVDFR